MKKLISNYHTHTFRCEHAYNGDDEDYVIRAIKKGIQELGFSDHAPFPNIIHQGMRMNFELLDDYINSIEHLKDKYDDQIKIYRGLEIEFMPRFLDYYQELLEKYHFDYLILGQHLKYDENGKNIFYYHKNGDLYQEINQYADDLISGMKTGFFKYVCHPDIFLMQTNNFDEKMQEISLKIIDSSIQYNIPLEININGFTIDNFLIQKGNFHYPSVHFFKLAKERGCKFIFGIDAHHPNKIDNVPYDLINEFLIETKITEKDIIDNLFMN